MRDSNPGPATLPSELRWSSHLEQPEARRPSPGAGSAVARARLRGHSVLGKGPLVEVAGAAEAFVPMVVDAALPSWSGWPGCVARGVPTHEGAAGASSGAARCATAQTPLWSQVVSGDAPISLGLGRGFLLQSAIGGHSWLSSRRSRRWSGLSRFADTT